MAKIDKNETLSLQELVVSGLAQTDAVASEGVKSLVASWDVN